MFSVHERISDECYTCSKLIRATNMSFLLPGSRFQKQDPHHSPLLAESAAISFTLDMQEEPALDWWRLIRLLCGLWFGHFLGENINHRLCLWEQFQNWAAIWPLGGEIQLSSWAALQYNNIIKRVILGLNLATQMFNLLAGWFIDSTKTSGEQ